VHKVVLEALENGRCWGMASINNLAAVLRNQGKYDRAEEMYRQELRLFETILGQDHPSTMTSASNLTFAERSKVRAGGGDVSSSPQADRDSSG
jgi:Tetratricopeptide repeat